MTSPRPRSTASSIPNGCRALPEAEALTQLEALPGVGPWTASAILLRGCGVADAVPMVDEISRTAVASIYGLPAPLDDATWTAHLRCLAPLPDVGDRPAPHGLARDPRPSTPSYRQTSKR